MSPNFRRVRGPKSMPPNRKALLTQLDGELTAFTPAEPSRLQALLYQRSNALSGHGLRVVLHDGSVFWSKGMSACRWCHALTVGGEAMLYPFYRREGGVIRAGWSCVEGAQGIA